MARSNFPLRVPLLRSGSSTASVIRHKAYPVEVCFHVGRDGVQECSEHGVRLFHAESTWRPPAPHRAGADTLRLVLALLELI